IEPRLVVGVLATCCPGVGLIGPVSVGESYAAVRESPGRACRAASAAATADRLGQNPHTAVIGGGDVSANVVCHAHSTADSSHPAAAPNAHVDGWDRRNTDPLAASPDATSTADRLREYATCGDSAGADGGGIDHRYRTRVAADGDGDGDAFVCWNDLRHRI